MTRQRTTCARRWARLSAAALLGLGAGAARGQNLLNVPPQRLPIWPPDIELLAQTQLPAPGQQATPTPKTPAAAPETKAAPPAPPPAAADRSSLESEQGAAGGGQYAGLSAPNVMGNLLGAGRSVSFFVNRLQGASFLNAVGSTNLVNPAVADNNSPVPRDRVYFRYNHFADALAVAGASSLPPVPFTPGTVRTLTATRSYDDDQYTFGFEKTFLDQRGSLEFRLPFSNTLAPGLDLSYGALGSTATVASAMPNAATSGPVFQNVVNTPQNTLGHSSTQLGNLTLIFKWLFWRSERFWLSGGVAGGVPTAPDTRVRVTDFLGPTVTEADTVRYRDFHVHNQTWSASPYLAGLVTPTDRLFLQGFLQFDVPLNESAVDYTEVVQHTQKPPGSNTPLVTLPVANVHDHLREQYLMHVDLNMGYWLLRRPEGYRLTGFAPALELHYTSTLNDASIVTLPSDTTKFLTVGQLKVPAPPPQVGNLRNRVDLLDLTMGTTFEFYRRTWLVTAFSLPLRGADNRTYDWEFQLQLNYYFGASATRRVPPAPSF